MLKPYYTSGIIEAGCDEAGRGCLAGPVFAAAVILPEDFEEPALNDSKKLSAKNRKMLRRIVEEKALAYGVGMADEKEIDQINILNASFLAMHRALNLLNPVPEYLIIDGNRFKPYPHIPHACIIKGDAIYASIAAASILAKTYRDDYMEGLHKQFPVYGWNSNKGYPTLSHRKAISVHGPCMYHRHSFRLLNDQVRMDFS